MEILASLGAVAQPIVVKKEKSELHLESKGVVDIPSIKQGDRNKENAESSLRPAGLGGANESSPNTLAAEAAAIAGMTALTERAGQPDGVPAEAEAPEPMGTPSDEQLRREEESAAGALMSLTGSTDKGRKRARALDFGGSPRGKARQRVQGSEARQLVLEGVGVGASPRGDRTPGGRKRGVWGALEVGVGGGLFGEAGGGAEGVGSAAGALAGVMRGGGGEGPGTPGKRRACNCKNSKCLKLYCECFAAGAHCEVGCNCHACHNNARFEQERKAAIGATLERNPMAFRPKIAAAGAGGEEESAGLGRHMKGCHCKKSGCLKKYCECFQAGVLCSGQCKCLDCRNALPDHAPGPRWLPRLAPAPPFSSAPPAPNPPLRAPTAPSPASTTPSPVSSRRPPAQPTPPLPKAAPGPASEPPSRLRLPGAAYLPSPPGPLVYAQHVIPHLPPAPPPALLAGACAPSPETQASGGEEEGAAGRAALGAIAEEAGQPQPRGEEGGEAEEGVRESGRGREGEEVQGQLRGALTDAALAALGRRMVQRAKQERAAASRPASAASAASAQLDAAPGEQRAPRSIPEGAKESGEGDGARGAGERGGGGGGAAGRGEGAMLGELVLLLRRLSESLLARPARMPKGGIGEGKRGPGKKAGGEEGGEKAEVRALATGGGDQPTAGPEPGEGDGVMVAMVS